MATTATTPRTNGRRADERSRPVPSAAATRRHRQAPLVALGVLLVLGCAWPLPTRRCTSAAGSRCWSSPSPSRPARCSRQATCEQSGCRRGAGSTSSRSTKRRRSHDAWRCLSWPGHCSPRPSWLGARRRLGSDVVAVGLKAGCLPAGSGARRPGAGGAGYVIVLGHEHSERDERQPDQCHRLGGHRRPSRLGRADGVLAPGCGERRRRGGGAGSGRSGQPGRGRSLRWACWRSARFVPVG